MSTLFVGRAEALRRCRSLQEQGFGGVLVGPPGVGKTRLLRELHADWAARGIPSTLVVCTVSTQAVPFGAFTSAVESARAVPSDGPEGLVQAAAALRDELGLVPGSVLAIDDAHLLDSASAGLVHQLVTEGVVLFCTVRAHQNWHVSLERLWREGAIERLEIGPLSSSATATLLQQLLSGKVDRGASVRIFERTEGNPLLVTELVGAARALGVLSDVRGVWRLSGELPPIPNATALLASNLSRLSDEQRRASRLVAAGEPLGHALAPRLIVDRVLEELETAGVIASDPMGHVIRLSHPLFRDAILADLDELDRRDTYRALVDAIEAEPRLELPRAVVGEWRLAAGLIDDGAELVELAELTHTSDPLLSERFREAATVRARDLPARLRIANLLAHQHRLTEAEQLIGLADLDSLPAADRVAALLSRCFLLVMPGHRPAEALDIVDALIAEFGPVPDMVAVRSTALWKLGRVEEAIQTARFVFENESAPVGARAHAGLTAASSMIHSGDAAGGVRVAARLAPILIAASAVLPEGPQSLALVEMSRLAHVEAELTVGFAVGRAGHRDAMLRGDDGVRAQYGHLLARLELLAGRVETSVDLLAETMVAEGIWCQTMRPGFHGLYVQALALSGRVEEASAALGELRSLRLAPLYDINLAMAEATVEAARGDLIGARERLTGAAQKAYPGGDRLYAQLAAYDAVRYGDLKAATLLRSWLIRPRGLLEQLQRDHAQALLDDNARSLLAVATDFGRRGLIWYELDATAQAISLAAAVGDEVLVTEGWRRLVTRRLEASALRSPVVDGLASRLLTSREFGVARAAAAGESDLQIAATLGISVRTAQTHLSRGYLKLGAGGRTELPSRLGPAGSA